MTELFPLGKPRCQHNVGSDRMQCVLPEGHWGRHVSQLESDAWWRAENKTPTVGDIRRIVREEVQRVLAEQKLESTKRQ
jgi:hypothetical protein